MELSLSREAASRQLFKNFQDAMEPEGSLSLSKSPPEPDHLTRSHAILHNIINPPMSWFTYWSLSFWISDQQPKCIDILRMRAIRPANVILLGLIIINTFGQKYKL
jgi:hypothetical protein